MTTEEKVPDLIPRFVPEGMDHEQMFKWETRDAVIRSPSGEAVYEQYGVAFPEGWDQNSINIVAQKYFWGDAKKGQRESSLKDLIRRVVGQVSAWAEEENLLEALSLTMDEFYHELGYLVADQRFSFNSPVWFNVGVDAKPQCSACFILSVEDTMESIAEGVKTEMLIFKNGSGVGSNRGALRSSKESVRGGGVASGPMSFIRVLDSGAGSVKSGGKTRRAAKMEILDSDHPDIQEFVTFKRDEERKAKILIEGGVDGSFCGEAYNTVSGQNANYSVRADDIFVSAVRADSMYTLRGRHDDYQESIRARDLMKLIAQCAWECADPGIQYDGPIQKMHTCAADGPIRATNPCSEYVFLDDTSCNLASINLLKYLNPDGTFDVAGFRQTVRLLAVAMDAFINFAYYPTEKIAKGTKTYRTLGIGFTGLGALLMHLGLPYHSAEAQLVAGAITSLMSAEAYAMSSRMADTVGAFDRFEANRKPFTQVMSNHHESSTQLVDMIDAAINAGMNGSVVKIARPLAKLSEDVWEYVVDRVANGSGVRNAQVTVLAPTGTISFMMGSQASTGIEPVLGLVTYKNLAGGGVLKQVNPWVEKALVKILGENHPIIPTLLKNLEETGSVFSSKKDVELNPRIANVLMTSFPDPVTNQSLGWKAHVDMMAACQPFISGAISKTINMPNEATVEDIENAYLYAYDKGLKCVAIYRDGSKGVQAIGTKLKTKADSVKALLKEVRGPVWGERVRLPTTRLAINTKFAIKEDNGVETTGFLHIGMNEQRQPKEVFVTFEKVGGSVQGFVHAWCKSVSFNLQLGLPWQEIVRTCLHTRFSPFGRTDNPDIPICSSVVDYIARFMQLQFDPESYQQLVGARPVKGLTRLSLAEPVASDEADIPAEPKSKTLDYHGDPVHSGRVCSCGSQMVRVGTCELCPNCGADTGCGGG